MLVLVSSFAEKLPDPRQSVIGVAAQQFSYLGARKALRLRMDQPAQRRDPWPRYRLRGVPVLAAVFGSRPLQPTQRVGNRCEKLVGQVPVGLFRVHRPVQVGINFAVLEDDEQIRPCEPWRWTPAQPQANLDQVGLKGLAMFVYDVDEAEDSPTFALDSTCIAFQIV